MNDSCLWSPSELHYIPFSIMWFIYINNAFISKIFFSLFFFFFVSHYVMKLLQHSMTLLALPTFWHVVLCWEGPLIQYDNASTVNVLLKRVYKTFCFFQLNVIIDSIINKMGNVDKAFFSCPYFSWKTLPCRTWPIMNLPTSISTEACD